MRRSHHEETCSGCSRNEGFEADNQSNTWTHGTHASLDFETGLQKSSSDSTISRTGSGLTLRCFGCFSKLSVKFWNRFWHECDGVSMLHTSAELDELFALTRARSTIRCKSHKALADRVARGLHPTAHSLLMPDKVGFRGECHLVLECERGECDGSC